MTENIETHKRRAGTNAELGHIFERYVMCLMYVRCQKLYNKNKLKSFKIASNVADVGAFDDIICRVQYEENGSLKNKLIFTQVKYKEDPKKHAFSDETLMNTSKRKKTDIPLIYKYIESFLKILQIFDDSEQCKTSADKDKSSEGNKRAMNILRNTFECTQEDLQFVYYTNATKLENVEMQFFEKIQNADIVTNILDTCSTGGMYKFKLNKIQLLRLFPELTKTLSQNEIDSVQQFINIFCVYICQESGQHLEDIIKKDIQCCLNSKPSDFETLIKTFLDEMRIVLQLDDIPFLTEKANYIEKVYSLIKLQSRTMFEREKYKKWKKIFSAETVNLLYNETLKQQFVQIQHKDQQKSSSFLKCLQLAEYLEEIKKSFEFLYVNADFLQVWKDVRMLHHYTKYDIVHVCIDKVPKEDIQQITSSEVRTNELIAIITESSNDTESSLLKQLSASGLEQIMNYCVTFQGVPLTLKEIFGGIYIKKILENTVYRHVLNALICRVLDGEDIEIGISLPVEEDIYIKRKYKTHALFLKFEALNEERDTFLIFPTRNVKSALNFDCLKNVLIFENEQNARINFYSCLKHNQNTHLCYVNTSLMVIVSHGTISNILKYKNDSDDDDEMNEDCSGCDSDGAGDIDEETFMQNTMNYKCTFISDDVGMGKSTALKRLSHYIKASCQKKWVEYVNLNLLDKKLKTINRTTNPICAVMQLLNLDEMGKMIFQHKCSTDGKVALLFDGFDEVSQEPRDNFHQLVQALSETKINTIVVSTRPIVETELKNNLLSIHYKIIGFSYDDMSSYLLKYWSKSFDKKCTEKLPEIVQDFVNQAIGMKEILRDIVAVPLQTKMLAETYNEKIISILLLEEGLQSFELPKMSLYSLYNNFINMHIDRCMQEKFNTTDDNNENYEFSKEIYFKRKSGIWEVIACKEMFPSIDICDTTALDIDDLAKQRIGIFVKINQEPVTFIHRSFAEFLAAKHVTRLLFESKKVEYVNNIYQKIMIGKTFTVLRKFMNAIYENERFWETADVKCFPELEVDDSVFMVAVEENNSFIFKSIFRNLSKNDCILKQILNHKNLFGESILHLSAKYCEQVFDDILNSKLFYCAKVCSNEGYTSLHAACKYGNENAVKSYLNKFKNESLFTFVDETDISILSPLMLAAQGGHINIIKTLCLHGASIHSKINGYNAVMYASEEGRFETVKYLIEQGAHVNEKFKLGKTVLMNVCRNIYRYKDGVECIRYLLEQQRADVNIQDEKGQTAVMNLIRTQDNIDILDLLVQQRADLMAVDSKGRNALLFASKYGQIETVKYLLKLRVYNVNEVDVNGDTCVILCSGAQYASVLQYFIEEHKLNLNEKNHFGETALFRALSKERYHNIKLLIAHGACVNICNNNGDTVLTASVERNSSRNFWLLYLKEKRYTGIVHFIVKQGADINHQNNLGNSMLHLGLQIDLLNLIELINLLVELGADINLKNKEGVTPTMMAENHEDPDVKSYFRTLIESKASHF